jgi:hypothetical protein
MRFLLLFVFVLLLCIGITTADVSCGPKTCDSCEPTNGVVNINLHNCAGFMNAFDTFTLDGVAVSPMQIIYSDSEQGFMVNLPAGTHTVKITAGGYKPLSSTVQVCGKKITEVDFTPVKLVSLGNTGINPGVVMVTTTTTTAASGSGGNSQSGGAFSNVPLPTTTVPAAGSTVSAPAGSSVTQASVPAQPDTLGTLSVKTDPAGAFIFIDGVQRGVTPATIPGIPAGTHTLLLKLDGYQDISTPVTISAGRTQEYSSAMAKAAAPAPAAAATTEAMVTPKKSPGFAFGLSLAGLGAVLCLRKIRS